jgi:putative ABC transport system permease protein
LLRSLGASRRQIAGAVLLEAAAIGVAGGVIGVAGGLLGARAALVSVRYSVVALLRSSLATEIVFEPWLAALGLGLALAVSLAAAVLPLEEALRTPPLQGLSDAAPRRLSLRSILSDVAALAALALGALWLANRPAWHGLPIAAMVACLAVMAMLLVGSARCSTAWRAPARFRCGGSPVPHCGSPPRRSRPAGGGRRGRRARCRWRWRWLWRF